MNPLWFNTFLKEVKKYDRKRKEALFSGGSLRLTLVLLFMLVTGSRGMVKPHPWSEKARGCPTTRSRALYTSSHRTATDPLPLHGEFYSGTHSPRTTNCKVAHLYFNLYSQRLVSHEWSHSVDAATHLSRNSLIVTSRPRVYNSKNLFSLSLYKQK